MAEPFTIEEREVLSRFCTNTDKSVFVLTNLPEVVKGALFSRYSRTDKSLRRVLLDEFINKPEAGFKDIVGEAAKSGVDQAVAIRKAEEFYERVLVGYGDDSVAELGGAHIACEDVSNIASKVLEDARIGLSPLEKSTRYVYFNQKNADGKYKYYREPDLLADKNGNGLGKLYEKTCDFLFDGYSALMEPVQKYITDRNPMPEGVTERAYKSTVRAKVCDILRGILPASALTNVGIFGNGRAFEYLLTKMYASELAEIRNVAASMQAELDKSIPSFVKRAPPSDRYGGRTNAYMTATAKAMRSVTQSKMADAEGGAAEGREEVTLIDYDEDAEVKAIAAMMYPYAHLPLAQLRELVEGMNGGERRRIVEEYLAKRENRRHKPGRALENCYYTFDVLGNYGAYRDLHRHRMLTQERQELSTLHGYDMPPELTDAGLSDAFAKCMAAGDEAYREISKSMPRQAQYAVPLAYRIRWYMKMNLREVYHFTELRSIVQGHPDYRRIAQQVYQRVNDVHPVLSEYMRYVDMSEAKLERLEAEKKTDQKLEELEKKYGKN